MTKSYKYRIYPTDRQRHKIDHTLNVCRLVYNLALETKVTAWQSARINVSEYDLCYQLVHLKNEYVWMKEVNSQSLQAAVKRLNKAFNGFYKGKGFPKFKSKSGKQSFDCPSNARKVDWDQSLLTIPKIPDIPIVLSKRFVGDIKTITISKTTSNKYFASIVVNENREKPLKPNITSGTTIGIDLGIKSFAVTSKGYIYAPNQYLKDSIKRLQCLQRRASRKNKGSNNQGKANLQVAKLYEKIVNQRTDYIHKITTELIRDNQAQTFVIEDLNVVGMVKNRKLSRAISDASFGEFRRQMTYKSDWYGKNLITIDRFAPSSKRCSCCGEINQNLTLVDREWVCVCGAHHDRDINAAKNIRHYGLEKITPAGSREEPVESWRLR